MHRLMCALPCVYTALPMDRPTTLLRLASLDARTSPRNPLDNKTTAVATGRLLSAPPFVCTASCVHRLVCTALLVHSLETYVKPNMFNIWGKN